MIARAVLALGSVLIPGMLLAAGFDCARATSAVEKAICADAGLSALDEHLARYYSAGRMVLKEGASCLRSDQQRWLQRRNACRDNACLNDVYLDRLAELDALQPGATAIRNVALPARPALAWVIPPAADQVAAPPNPKARSAQFSGAIMDEVATGDGYVLRAAGGERHLLLPLMFIDGASATHLQALAREKDKTFRVTGHVTTREGRTDFEPSRCIFIHRIATTAEGRIFPDPAQPHPGFKAHQLAFATPRDGMARAEFRSQPFFAVILKTAPRCSVTEAERLQVQAMFPSNKVFAPRFECDDSSEEHVTYTNVDPTFGFLAVHAGATSKDAETMLATARSSGRFPGANIRRMQAVLIYP